MKLKQETPLKDEEFMQIFWHLASDDWKVRQNASKLLVSLTKNKDKEDGYLEYAFSRLFRGLSSARDSARQGFSVALTMLLAGMPIPIEKAVKLLDQHTQATSSLKGFEERDILFAKLFGCVSIVRSCKMKNQEDAMLLLERLLEIYDKKQWIQEMVIECILLLIKSCDPSFMMPIVSRVMELLPATLTEFVANNMQLLLGLQNLSKQYKIVFESIKNRFGTNQPFHLQFIQEVSTALLASSSKFPKIHRVWDYLLGFVVSMDSDGDLLTLSTTLNEEKRTFLKALVDFIEDHMRSSSKERRALGMKLTVKLIQHVPADSIPFVITPGFIKSLISARAKPQNLLFDFAGAILEELEHLVGEDSEKLLSVAFTIFQLSGHKFDVFTSSNTLKKLLAKMNFTAAEQLLRLLIADMTENSKLAASKTTIEDEENEGDMESNLNNFSSNVLYLAKTYTQSDKNALQLMAFVTIMRLTVCSGGKMDSKHFLKALKKSGIRGSTGASHFSPEFLKEVSKLELQNDSEQPIMKEQLLSFLTDLIFESSRLNQAEDMTFALEIWNILGLLIKFHSHFSSKVEVTMVVEEVEKSIQYLESNMHLDLNNDNLSKTRSKYIQSGISLLIISFVHHLCFEDLSSEVVTSLSSSLTNFLSKNLSSGVEVDEEDDPADVRLFESCVDLLSYTDESSIRGIREGIKKLWNSVVILVGDEDLSSELIDSIMDVVADTSITDDPSEDNEELDEDGGEDEQLTKPKSSKMKIDKIEEPDDDSEIIVHEDELLDILAVDENSVLDGSDNDSNAGELVHTKDADDALVNMLHLRQENRKKGLVQLMTKQLLMRSRVLDILECVINRLKSGAILFSLFFPLVQGLRKLVNSKIVQTQAVGKSFTSRLSHVIIQLCKKKLPLRLGDSADLSVELIEELKELFSFLRKQFSSKHPQLKASSNEIWLAVTRMIISSDNDEAKQYLLTEFSDITKLFCLHRRSNIPLSFLETTICERFPSFFIPSLWTVFLDGLENASTIFVKSSICEMMLTIIKKYSTFDVSIKSVINNHASNLLQKVQDILGKSNTEENTTQQPLHSVKRLKPMLNLLKQIVSTLPTMEVDHGTMSTVLASINETLKVYLEQGQAATVEPILKAIDKYQSDRKENAGDKKKESKKENADDKKESKKAKKREREESVKPPKEKKPKAA